MVIVSAANPDQDRVSLANHSAAYFWSATAWLRVGGPVPDLATDPKPKFPPLIF